MTEHKIPKEILEHPGLILLGYRGSVAHGMYVPASDPQSIDDVDLMGVSVLPKEFYLGLSRNQKKQTQEIAFEENGILWDFVCYELQKFVGLLLKGNPNVLGLLWLKPEHYLKTTPEGQMLLTLRKAVTSKSVYHSFIGYAHGQLKRMEQYERKGYMGEKRKALVEKFGYDTKNAGHLIRLLRMGIEFLNTGELRVFRDHDSDLLLSIKKGERSLQWIKDQATSLFEEAKVSWMNSTLPSEPDRALAEHIVMNIITQYWGRTYET